MDMVRRALAWMAASLVACNAITDTGKYQVVDCPSGSCGDGGGSSGSSGTPPPPSTDSGGGADTGADAKPMCAANQGRITLTVTGSSGRVDEDRGQFSVSATPSGNTQVECAQPDGAQLRLRTSGGSASWTGVSCGTTDDCQFAFHAGDDLTVTATFP
jgi:hypothetical protein